MLQVTFSEKWTKNDKPKSTFQDLKSLVSSIKSTETKYFIAFQFRKECQIADKKSLFLWILLVKIRISNFEMWSWDVIFVPFSE